MPQEMKPENYVEAAEISDYEYDVKMQQASQEEGAMELESLLDSTINGVQNGLRLLAKRIGEMAARPDPRTYMEQLARPHIEPTGEEEAPKETMADPEVDQLVQKPADEKALEQKPARARQVKQ